MLGMARQLWLAGSLAFGVSPALASQGLPDGLPSLPKVGDQITVDAQSGLALDGFDAVSYHLGGQAEPGLARFEAEWRGGVWRFASEANRQAFLADPEGFAPRFNGYDAAAISTARPVQSDPTLFAIVQGRLFLFRTAANRAAFLAGEQIQRQAEARWPDVRTQLTR